MAQIRTGHFQSAGTAYNLVLGFVPTYLKLVNQNAADGEVMMIEWFGAEQGNEYAFQTYKHVASGFATTDTTIAAVSTAGWCTAYNANSISTVNPITVSGGKGVTIHADFSDDNDEIWYLAIEADRDVDTGDVA
jgi:hypothetical protein